MRYAANLAAGDGLVYNPGERVLGTTTPLYAIILAAGLVLGIAPWYAALVLDVLCLIALCLVVYQLCRHAAGQLLGAIAVALMLADPHHLISVAGMETGLFSLLVYGSLLALQSSRVRTAILLSTLAAFTRPEGLLIWLLVLVHSTVGVRPFRFRDNYRRYLALAIVPLIAFWIALTIYYGSPLPQSMLAKQSQSAASARSENLPLFVAEFARNLFHVMNIPAYAWGVAQLLGVLISIVCFPGLRPLFIWGGAYLLFMLAGRAPSQYWYHQPLFPLQCIAVAAFATQAARWATGLAVRTSIGSRSSSLPITAAIAALVLLGVGYTRLDVKLRYYLSMYYMPKQMLDFGHYREAAEWVRARATPRDEIAGPEIGYIGMFSGMPIYDCMGLVSPAALRKYGKHDIFTATALRGSRYMITRFRAARHTALTSAFLAAYKPVWIRHEHGWSTYVFERSTEPLLQVVGSAAPGTAGVIPLIGGYNYVVGTNRDTPGERTSHFRYIGNVQELNGRWSTGVRQALAGTTIKLDDQTTITTTADGTMHLTPTRHFNSGFTLTATTRARNAWVVLESAVLK